MVFNVGMAKEERVTASVSYYVTLLGIRSYTM